jgi:sorting and assembly machinery component 37
VKYLTQKGLCKNLDEGLDAAQAADNVAYAAFLTANAAPLLDLSLYVSAANWSTTTRPTYTKLLPFPLKWTIPPLVRDAAIKRTEHLGLAELDSDFDPSNGLHLSTGRESLPESFRRHLPLGATKTVRDEMTPEQAVAIRLFSVTEDCLSVIDELLSTEDKKLRFFGSGLSSLDCLAFGYLSLMRDAPVPRSFLKEWLTSKAPRLSMFVDDMRTTCIMTRGELPWADAQPMSLPNFTGRALRTSVLNAPGIGEHYAAELRRRAEEGVIGVDQRAFVLAVSAALASLAVGYGVYYYKAMPPFGARTQIWRASQGGTKLSQFGALGFILNDAMGPDRPYAGAAGSQQGVLVGSDSDID